MLHLPFLIVSNIAKKAAMTTANLAGKAARVATSTADKAARMKARAAQKAASKAHLHAMRSLPRKPTVRLVKEVRSGRTSMSFYRKFDHGSGRVSDFWTLNRDTPGGRIRVASGPMSEFKNLREVVDRSLAREAAPRRQEARDPRDARARREARQGGRGRDANRRDEPARASRPASYSLVYVEGVNRDGTARARVVKSFGSLEQARAAHKRNKGLFLHRHHGRRFLGRNDVVNLDPSHVPGVAALLEKTRDRPRPDGRGRAVNGRDAGADQGRRRDHSIER